MPPFDVVLRIDRLLNESSSTRREVAPRMNVSRATVRRAVQQHRQQLGGDALAPHNGWQSGEPRATRCRGCGGLVYEPCLLCRVRRLQALERAVRAMRGPGSLRPTAPCESAKPRRWTMPVDRLE